MKKTKVILSELKDHMPFTFTATLIAVIFVFLLKNINFGQSFFIIHPLHIFFSAIVSSAIFIRHKKNIIQALFVGIFSAIFIGTISDIIFPYLGGIMFNLKTTFHLSLIEEPIIILLVSLLGGIIGITTKYTKFPHFMHVFLSIFASLFYLITFSTIITTTGFAIAFAIVFLAVFIPCCISDIIFPLLFLEEITKPEKSA